MTGQRFFARVVNGRFRDVLPSREATEMTGEGGVIEVTVTPSAKGSYWAWMDRNLKLIMVTYSIEILDMCFPNGLRYAEAAGEGERTRVNVVAK